MSIAAVSAAVGIAGVIKSIKEGLDAQEVTPVLRERLLLAMDRLAFAADLASASDKEVARLKEALADATEEIRKLHDKLEAQPKTPSEDFVEEAGVLFKRRPVGGYHDAAFCPNCKSPMVSLMDFAPFECGKCGTRANFNGQSLRGIMARLPK